ncbi:MAG: 30S ribosome-binding factor RbfA [Acidobacteriota bacterium]
MRPQGRRPARVGESIRMAISELLLREMRGGTTVLTTVTGVKMSPDLKQARVYISVLGGSEDRQRALDFLHRHTAHIRHELGAHLRLKSVPELTFLYDKSIEYGARIEELIEQTKSSESAASTDDD